MSSTTSSSGTAEYKVSLYLYDISQGMAKALSAGFLGKQIDGIWHTGIVVYGYEYFYGGGIAASYPGNTMAGQPIQIIELGYTSKTQREFHDWLNQVSNKFTPANYSLLNHNCNNFTSDAAVFLTSKPIPDFITGLPQEAINTPLGQMFLPMIQQMEQQMRSNQGGAGMAGMVPWNQGDVLQLPPVNNNIKPDRINNGLTTNPNNNTSAPITNNIPHTKPEEAKTVAHNTIVANPTGGVSKNLKHISLSSKPFLASDRKISSFQVLIKTNAKKLPQQLTMTENDKTLLDNLVKLLSSEESVNTNNNPVITEGVKLFDNILANWPAELLFPVYGIFRLLVLNNEANNYYRLQGETFVKNITRLLPSSTNKSLTSPAAAQAMAICSISNCFSHPEFAKYLANNSNILDIASYNSQILDNSSTSATAVNIRLMSCTLLYNISLNLPQNDDSDNVIELVSTLNERLQHETDSDCYERLLLCLGHLLNDNSSAALIWASLETNLSQFTSKLSGAKNATKIQELSNDVESITQQQLAQSMQ